MCLGLPLKIVEINGKEAIGEMHGVRRKIRIDLIADLKIDDYVMVHAGFALEKIKEEQAKDSIEAFLEVERALKED